MGTSRTVFGFACKGDAIDYVILTGTTRADAVKVAGKKLAVPANTGRPSQLNSLGREVSQILLQHQPSEAVFKPASPPGGATSRTTVEGLLRRAEVEGIAQQAFAAAGIDVTSLDPRTLYSDLGCSKDEFEERVGSYPAGEGVPKSRIDAVAVALSRFEDPQ